MAYSTDSNLQELIPDILDFGIAAFTEEHESATADIQRELRSKWFYKLGISGEMDTTLLTDSQFTKASSYLVLWKYALPQLTNWVDNDRFLNMIDFYKQRYNEEMASIFADGVEYDRDGDDTVTLEEKKVVAHGRLIR